MTAPSAVLRNTTRTSLCALAALTALSGCATISLPKPGDIRLPPFQYRMRDFQLPSGMRIVLQEDHASPHVAIVTVVGRGATSDPAGKEGLAHVVEHLAFRAVPKPGAPSAWTMLRQLGAAEMNAYTSQDETVYHEVVHTKALRATLELELQRVLHPLDGVTPEVFTVEREVVRNELRQRGEMQLSGEVFQAVNELLFDPAHPYSRPVIGTHGSLDALTLADAQAFVAEHYRPENMTLFLAGDVDLAQAEKLLGPLLTAETAGDPAKPKPLARRVKAERQEPPAPPATASRSLYASSAEAKRPELWIAWTLPGDYRDNTAVEGELLEQNLRAILDIYTEDREHEIADLSVFRVPGTLASTLFCRVQLREGTNPEVTADHVLNQVHRLWAWEDEDKLTAIRVQNRIRWITLASLAYQSDDLHTRALDTAVLTHFSGSPTMFGSFFKGMVETPNQKIGELAQRYLARDRARVLYVYPNRDPKQAAPTGLTGVGAPLDQADTDPVTREEAPTIPELFALASAPGQRFTLENGLEVWLQPGRPGVAVHVALAFFGGSTADAKSGELFAQNRTVRQREHRNGFWFEYGALSYGTSDRDRELWMMRAPSGNLENALALLLERVEKTEVSNELWLQLAKRDAALFAEEDGVPQKIAERAFREALYGDRSYGHVAKGADLKELAQSDVEQRLSRIHTPKNAVLIVVGARDPVKAELEVRRWFGGWGGAGDRVPAPIVALPKDAQFPVWSLTEHPGATQVRMRVGCVLTKSDARREATHDVLARVMGYGLERRFRQELGASYGAYGRATRLRGGVTEIEIDTQVGATRIAEVLQTFKGALAAWAKDGVTAREVEDERWSVARDRAWSLTSNLARTWALAQSATLGDPPDALAHYASYLQAVSKPAVDQALAECQRHLVVSLEGPKDALEAARPR